MTQETLIKLQSKIKGITDKGKMNEEQTKTGLIMPMFMGLGYDVFDINEFVPEYVADFGTKQGEKVDYAICINGQPMILIEAKKLGINLGKDQVSQLFRYYASTDAKIAILTNGDDYWFFTDSVKANQMDTEPYLKIKISELSETDISVLENYTRANIENIDIVSDVKLEKCKSFISDFIDGIYTGNINRQFIEWIIEQSNSDGIEKTKIASIFDDTLTKKFNITRKSKEDTPKKAENKKVDKAKKGTWDRSKASEIIVGTEYIFNEVDWKFHKPDYIKLFDVKYETKHYSDVEVVVLEVLCKKFNGAEDKFADITTITSGATPEGWRKPRAVEGTSLIVETSVDSGIARKTLERALDLVGVKHEELKICFEK